MDVPHNPAPQKPASRNRITRRSAILAGAGLAVTGLGLGRQPARATRAGHAAALRSRLAADVKPGALTLQQQAGQRVICSYSGLTPPDSLLQQISDGEASGVIFITGNISSESQISSVIQQLAEASQQSPVDAPLLLMTDQEGGEVNRLPGAPALSEKEIGEASGFQTEAGDAGTGAGQNLAGVGMNVDLAPVLGVYRQAGDFLDQYQRSYSMNANEVALCAQSFITAMQQTGVVPTAKHFPGLGAATASQDTDVEPVVLDIPLGTLRSVDELPYRSAISAGVQMIMVSWATYPALDASNPAGLSSAVVQDELRSYLGYQGVTITDALEAGALEDFGTTQQRAVLAAQAGMDLILCADGESSQNQDAVTGLADALQSGQLSQSGFTASVQRITALRDSL
jgi:beta-N-acetylhexosaminidase